MLLFIRNGERFHLENTSFTLGYINDLTNYLCFDEVLLANMWILEA